MSGINGHSFIYIDGSSFFLCKLNVLTYFIFCKLPVFILIFILVQFLTFLQFHILMTMSWLNLFMGNINVSLILSQQKIFIAITHHLETSKWKTQKCNSKLILYFFKRCALLMKCESWTNGDMDIVVTITSLQSVNRILCLFFRELMLLRRTLFQEGGLCQ